jgi:hypothetical protein
VQADGKAIAAVWLVVVRMEGKHSSEEKSSAVPIQGHIAPALVSLVLVDRQRLWQKIVVF